MRINHNIAALNTHRQLNTASSGQAKSMEKLSSGLRINRAGDDAAGLAISEKMRAQVRGLDQASKNAQDGISLIQTAEGALNETHDILQRVRELADQSANGTNTAEDRKAIQDEVTQLKQEIDRIGNTTEFNTQKLLNGNLKSAGGASVGQNTTTGTSVGKLAAGTITVSAGYSLTAASFSAAEFVAETINVDGTEITVNWQNLSTEERNIISGAGGSTDANAHQKAVDLIVSKINEAIDQSGSGVAHVSGYHTNGAITLTSGSEGTSSKITAGNAGVLKEALGATPVATSGTNSYNGTTVSNGSTFKADINGVTMEVTLTAAISNTDAMSTAADVLQSALNTAIASANSTAGATSTADPGFISDVRVNVTKDGRFEIVSETGPVKLADNAGSTAVRDLGLSSAQTEASGNGGMTFQIGANKGQTITFGINDMRSAALGVSSVDVSTQAGASKALESLDNAIKNVSSERAKLGAVQNRLEHTINNLNTSSENLTAAESRIRDVDMAKEMMNQTKNSILSQAAQAMLAQANQQPQGVLQLLR
ncbi:flagellin [Metabacillus fastidiosus]|uniref:flagellin N-terminal helical domain-containing protein n=1 Tax=Metabacillus fastidiosus TaxID=1458 RepID=UPI003D2AEB95